MSTDTSSVPRWSRTPPAPDERGTAFAVVTVGAPGAAVGRSWLRELRARPVPTWSWPAPHYSDTVRAALVEQVRAARVGWRLMISAPEASVARLMSAALAEGAVPGELTAHVSDEGARRVRCAHCTAVTVTEQELGATVECVGCRRGLLVYAHFSRHLASYLGFQADAEDPPGA